MTEERKQQITQYIESGLTILWGIVLVLFPLLFTTYTTEAFVLPKELFVGFVILISLLAWGAKTIVSGQVRISRTPLDVPVLLFGTSLILSSIFAVNKADSLLATGLLVLTLLGYFVITNSLKKHNAGFFLLSALVTGGAAASAITVLAHFKLYVLPFASSRAANFSLLGSYLDFVFFMAILLPLALHFITPVLKKQLTARVGVFGLASLVLAAGIAVIGKVLVGGQVNLLPFDAGFQTAFAAISQDNGRLLQGFFFGSGYGTFYSVFSRFHSATLNSNPQLWYLSFSSSSSLVLELLATTGLVGVLSYVFIVIKTLLPIAKKRSNPFYVSLLVAIVLSFVLPFTYIELALFVFLLAGFSLYQKTITPHEYFDVELKFVALKKGVLTFMPLEDVTKSRRDGLGTSLVATTILLALVVVAGYYLTTFAVSDATFQHSLQAANANNGTLTYKLQTQAIQAYPYRSGYYRIFSQTNIALANSLLALGTGKSSPSAQAQQTALQLIQQSITAAKQATALAPQSVAEWQNLASVYRSLIGVGQNADSFAVSATQQAVILDPNNPQEYLTLGGLYFQLGQYDNAIIMFQRAVALKQDYANAYYNLGHSYEQKGDLQNALAQYQIVKQLMQNDPTNYKKISDEITALQAKIGSVGQQTTGSVPAASGQQQPLNLNSESTTLPPQPTKIPLLTPTPTK